MSDQGTVNDLLSTLSETESARIGQLYAHPPVLQSAAPVKPAKAVVVRAVKSEDDGLSSSVLR